MVKYILRKLDYGYLIGIKKKILYPNQFLTLKRSINKRGLNFKNKFKVFLFKSSYNSYKNIYKFFNIKKIKENYINLIPNLYLKKKKSNRKIGNLKRGINFIFINNGYLKSNNNFFIKNLDSQKIFYKLFDLYFNLKLYLHRNIRKLIIKKFNRKLRKKFRFVRKNIKFNLNKKIKFTNIYKSLDYIKSIKIKKEEKKKKKHIYQIRKRKKRVYMNYIAKYIKSLLFKKLIKYKKTKKKLNFSRKIINYLIKYNIGRKNKTFFNSFKFIRYKKKFLNKFLFFKYKRKSKIPFMKVTHSLLKIKSMKLNFYSTKILTSVNKYLKNSKDSLILNNLKYENIMKYLILKKNKLWHKFFLNFLYIFFFKHYKFKILTNKKKKIKKHYRLNLNFFNLERHNKTQVNVHLFESQNSFFFFRFLRMSKKLLDLFKPIKSFFFKKTEKVKINENLLYYKIISFYIKNSKTINNCLIFLMLNNFINIFNIKKKFIFLNFLLYMVALKQNLYFKRISKC